MSKTVIIGSTNNSSTTIRILNYRIFRSSNIVRG